MSRAASFTRLAIGAGRANTGSNVIVVRAFKASARQCDAKEDIMTKVKTSLKDSMRSKDSFKSTVLRGLLSEYQYATKGASNPDTVDFAGILQKAISKRQESSRQFRAAKREDLAEKEDREGLLIQELLPKQMLVEELEEIVSNVIAEVQKGGVTGKRLLGEVMKAVSSKVDKSRAPGSVVSEIVRKLLPKD